MKSFFIIFWMHFGSAYADGLPELPIYVFDVKPLIYADENNNPRGTWYDSFEEFSKIAGIKFHYQFVSIPRLEILLAGERPGCNLTLLKTKKRLDKHINFIFDHPVKSIFKVYQRFDDPRKFTLHDLQSDPKLKIVSNTTVATDGLLEKGIKADLLFNINSIANMLTYKRIDIYVGSNVAVEKLPEFREGKIKAGIELMAFTHGIGCSNGTPKEVITKLKKASRNWKLSEL